MGLLWACFQLITPQHQHSQFTKYISQDIYRFKNVIITSPFIYPPERLLQVQSCEKRCSHGSYNLKHVWLFCALFSWGSDVAWPGSDRETSSCTSVSQGASGCSSSHFLWPPAELSFMCSCTPHRYARLPKVKLILGWNQDFRSRNVCMCEENENNVALQRGQ